MGKKSKPAPPPAPDYAALAEKTAQANLEAQLRADWANRPTQTTPWGTSSWEVESVIDPSTGKPVNRWRQNIALDPRAQRALDDQFSIQEGMSGAAKGLIGRATDSFNTPFDTSRLTQITGIDPSQLGDYQQLDISGLPNLRTGLDQSALGDLPDAGFGAVQEVQNAMMSRLAPDLARRRESEIQRLKAQGLEEGSRAWATAMEGLNRGENDASMQALLGATQAYGDIFNRGLARRQQQVGEQSLDAQLASGARGQLFGERDRATSMANLLRGQRFGEQIQQANLTGQQRQQQIAEQAYLRSLPLNELNALLSGNQVSMPSMPGFATSASAGGADYLGATSKQYQDALSAYNAQLANQSNRLGGLMGLAGRIGGSLFGPVGNAIGGWMGRTVGGWLG